MTTPKKHGTGIEWTHLPGHKGETWNPIRAKLWEIQDDGSGKERIGWHCEHVSEGCRNCYAETQNLQGARGGTMRPYKPGELRGRPGYSGGGIDSPEIFLDEKTLLKPLHWRAPRGVFVCSMTDLFADFVTDEMLDRIFAVMAKSPNHIFQVLTKRPARMREYLSRPVNSLADGTVGMFDRLNDAAIAITGRHAFPSQSLGMIHHPGWPLANVWLGVSVEDQATANERIPELLATPASCRFVSYEPALGPVDFTRIDTGLHDGTRIVIDALTGTADDGHDSIDGIYGNPNPHLDQIIAGGESGKHARPAHPDWFRSTRDQCAAAGVAFLFKQWGEFFPVGQVLPGYGKIHGATGVKPGRMNLHYAGTPKQSPKHAFAKRGVSFSSTSDGLLTFRLGKKRAGRTLDGVEHTEFPLALLDHVRGLAPSSSEAVGHTK